MRLREDIIALYMYLERGCRQAGVDVFSKVTSDRTKGVGLNLYRRRFRLENGKTVSAERVVRYWNRLSREVVQSPALKVFEERVDMALRMWFSSEHGWANSCNDLKGPFQPKCFCDLVLNAASETFLRIPC